MKAKTALAILECAKEGGYYDDPIPEAEEELIKEAKFYFQHAEAAAETKDADNTIKQIVAIGRDGAGYTDEEPEAVPTTEDDAPAPAEIKAEHLPVPRQIEGDPPEMPFDISDCSDKEIRRLASQFQACLNRAIWQLKQTMDRVLRARQLRESAYRKAYLAEEVAARENGVKPTKEALDLAAKESPEYKKLDDEVFDLERQVGDYKALKEIYEGNVSRLSREATLRDDEYKRSGKVRNT